MTASEPKVRATDRFSVGITAQILEVDRKTLLNHTTKGLIKCGFHRSNKRRFYTGSEIVKYWKATI